jgi:hypothetical protein
MTHSNLHRGLLWLVAISAALPAIGDDAATHFRKHVAPILERKCLSCHEGKDAKGELSLATRELALAGGEGGESIVPGKPDESSLLDYISGDSPEMPKEGKPLTADEVAALRQWIATGAVWPDDLQLVDKHENDTDWWSYKPLTRPALPNAKSEISNQTPAHRDASESEIKNPIDAFILAKLDANGMSPSPVADSRALIRRAYFDLIGLPPTADEVDAFVADTDPQAYEKLIDRLLDSPQYGERWARHWLDVVHYGDTHGYDKDKPRPTAWPYRDYIIRAFNQDKPYRQFVQEQIAGDVLYADTRDCIEALGFISAGPWDFIGHIEVPEEKTDGKIARLLDRDDMVANTFNTFNSTTVQCARCHNHKFDPVTQYDYYSLHAVFAALDRADKSYDTDPKVATQRRTLTSEQASLTAEQTAMRDAAQKRVGDELADLDRQIAQLTKPKAGQSSPAEAYGYHSAIEPKADVTKWVQIDLGQPQAVSEVVVHPCKDNYNNIGEGFGFPVRFKIELSDDPDFRAAATKIVDHTAADYPNPKLKPLRVPANGQLARFVRITATKLALRQNDYNFALAEVEVFDVTKANVAVGKTVTALDTIELAPRWRLANLVDRYYPGANLSGDPQELETLQAQRKQLLEATLEELYPARWRQVAGELAGVEKQISQLPPQNKMYAGTVHHGTGAFRGTGATGGKPRPIHVLYRGNVNEPREPVGPGTLRIIEGVPAQFTIADDQPEGARRAALAQWLTDDRNPLTWRSIVNRMWVYHFGRGIVDSPNDFGRMGQLPSHPELLDWLAIEFRDGGEWLNAQSLKSLHRLICTSATYRQSSADNAKYAEIDGGNQYLWRMNRRRLEAEAVRDAVLLVAGKLNPKMGGPGYQDFVIEQPAHSPHYMYDKFDPEDPACHRRSVYRFIVRSQPQPFMATLDCADPSMSVDKRNESLTALQALALLNNKFVVVMAKHFAERLQTEAATLPEQLRLGFRHALSRDPSDEELSALVAYAQQHDLPNACRVLLNLNEFAFVD